MEWPALSLQTFYDAAASGVAFQQIHLMPIVGGRAQYLPCARENGSCEWPAPELGKQAPISIFEGRGVPHFRRFGWNLLSSTHLRPAPRRVLRLLVHIGLKS